MDEPIYVIDHMIVMGINVEKTSFLQEKPFMNFRFYIYRSFLSKNNKQQFFGRLYRHLSFKNTRGNPEIS